MHESKTPTLHIMIDIETASRQQDAAILSVAAVPFHPFTPVPGTLLGRPVKDGGDVYNKAADDAANEFIDECFYEVADMSSCYFAGMHFEQDTQEWWLKKSPAAIAELDNPDSTLHINKLLQNMADWINAKRYEHPNIAFWCRGLDFDFPILKNAFERFGIDTPWQYYERNDARTFCNITLVPHPTDQIQHTALGDCLDQVAQVQEAFEALKPLYAQHGVLMEVAQEPMPNSPMEEHLAKINEPLPSSMNE